MAVKKKEKLLSDKNKLEIDSLNDKRLVEVWKIYYCKAKNFDKHSYQEKKNNAIADYAMKLHKENNKKSRFRTSEDETDID